VPGALGEPRTDQLDADKLLAMLQRHHAGETAVRSDRQLAAVGTPELIEECFDLSVPTQPPARS